MISVLWRFVWPAFGGPKFLVYIYVYTLYIYIYIYYFCSSFLTITFTNTVTNLTDLSNRAAVAHSIRLDETANRILGMSTPGDAFKAITLSCLTPGAPSRLLSSRCSQRYS